MLLGLKGSLNEYELDPLRQRSLSGAFRKSSPPPLGGRRPSQLRQGRQSAGEGSEEPDPGAIRLVFDKVAEHRQRRVRRSFGFTGMRSIFPPGRATATSSGADRVIRPSTEWSRPGCRRRAPTRMVEPGSRRSTTVLAFGRRAAGEFHGEWWRRAPARRARRVGRGSMRRRSAGW